MRGSEGMTSGKDIPSELWESKAHMPGFRAQISAEEEF